MARAKRTARAEARRRYRAQVVQEPDDELEDDETAARSTERAVAPAKPIPGARPGFRNAFSQSFRPFDLRGDLAYLPILIRQRSVLIPLLITVGVTILFVTVVAPPLKVVGAQPTITDHAVIYVYQIFVLPPPIGAAFLAGFLAVRASWLAGVIVSAVAAICLAASSPAFLAIPSAAVTGSTAGAPSDTFAALLLQALGISVPMGALFAAMAAWYKRFLNLANPNRMQRQAARQGRDGNRRTRDTRPARGR